MSAILSSKGRVGALISIVCDSPLANALVSMPHWTSIHSHLRNKEERNRGLFQFHFGRIVCKAALLEPATKLKKLSPLSLHLLLCQFRKIGKLN